MKDIKEETIPSAQINIYSISYIYIKESLLKIVSYKLLWTYVCVFYWIRRVH